MGAHRTAAAALLATCWAPWLADSQEVSTFSKEDKYFYLTSAMTCEDAGLAIIDTPEECKLAASAKAGWVGQVQLASDPVMCGCVIGRSTGKVALALPPHCNRRSTCADSESCFCKQAEDKPAHSDDEAAPAAGPPPEEEHRPAPRHPSGGGGGGPKAEGEHVAPPGKVDCGGHYSDDCSACPEGNGQPWCNGDCAWLKGACVAKAPPTASPSVFGFLENPFGQVEGAISGILGGEASETEEITPPHAHQERPEHVPSRMVTTTTASHTTAKAATTEQPHDTFKCPGAINVEGYGPVELVNAKWNVPGERAERIDVRNDEVVAHMKGRSYFADACRSGPYDNKDYVAMKLLGKKMTYTTDISGAGCGCNAALYMTSLHQSSNKSKCHDHYCDANSVCGEACAEIDLQEANNVAWHSTLHVFNDGGGLGGGFGGGGNGWSGPRDWAAQEFQPGSDCIDTAKPFQVAVSFPIDASGELEAMSVVLSQEGSDCELSTCVQHYGFGGRNGMAEVTKALERGMTPIISYWSSDILIGMDGEGPDHKGPCVKDDPDACADTVKFYDFSITDIPPDQPTCRKQCSSEYDSCKDTGCCNAADRRCFEKDESWASCKTSCEPGIDPLEPEDQQSPWTCRLLGDQTPLPSQPRHSGHHSSEHEKRHERRHEEASTCSEIGDNCKATGCCVDDDRQCYEKDETYASCRTGCTAGIDENEDAAFQSPWSCKVISKSEASRSDDFWGGMPEDKAANPYEGRSYELMSKSSEVSGASGFWRPSPSVASAFLAAACCLALAGAMALSAWRRATRRRSHGEEAAEVRAAKTAQRPLDAAKPRGDEGYLCLHAAPDSPLCSPEIA